MTLTLGWQRDLDARGGNAYQLVMGPTVPFGGYKMSGYDWEPGIHQLDKYLNVKAVWVKAG
jgi:aldehyde dehydrogenase (NAD+)